MIDQTEPPWGALVSDLAPCDDKPAAASVTVERMGPTYQVDAAPLGARFTFRDVRTAGELAADVSVSSATGHLFRTTTTLTLTGREKIAKTASELDGGPATYTTWRAATFSAVEAVLQAEENIGRPVDLRTAGTEGPPGGLHLSRPIWPVGSAVLVAPGEAGKSTIARAVAVCVAGGIVTIPGVQPPKECRPVLYVAAEDPSPYWHARSIEAICRGLGIDRSRIAQPVELFDARGRPLHRLVRALAERAGDHGAIVLDSQQALLAQLDASGGVRDRDSQFWRAVDELEASVFVIAHPNRADSRDWNRAEDGRIAGSEVNRDRPRMTWRATWKDAQGLAGESRRAYTLTNTKNSHDRTEPPLGFTAEWTFGIAGDTGSLRFTESTPQAASGGPTLSKAMAETLAAYESGATTAPLLLDALPHVATLENARQRLSRLREHLSRQGEEA
jgi:AAA domain